MNDEPVKVDLKDGRRTTVRWDDAEAGAAIEEKPRILVDEKLNESVLELPENWLRSRVRAWMDSTESPDMDWWIGSYTPEGTWIWASSGKNSYTPLMHRIDFARRICKYVNRDCNNGGAWLAGWIRNGREFYLLWKDPDGDIAIPMEFPQPFNTLVGWNNEDFAEHCAQAHATWVEWHKNMEYSRNQQRKLAQGDTVADNHLAEAPPVGI